jgi:hypothetical protein
MVTSPRPTVAVEPRTLSQRTLLRRLRDHIATGAAAAVVTEAADELERLTTTPDLSALPDISLLDQLDELDHPVATAAADEILRLRAMCRSLFYDCEAHTSRYRPNSVSLVVPAQLHALIRAEARRP